MFVVYNTQSSCPTCKRSVESRANVTNLTGGHGEPVAGDYTVCIFCSQPLRYRADLSLEAVKMSKIPEKLWPPIDRARLAIQIQQTLQERAQA